MESEIKDLREDMKKMMMDIALIKNALVAEGELSDWALEELEEARNRKNKVSHEEAKKMILGR